MSRSGKFYYKNEREVMESLGMKQTPGSGNGWIAKEDGENEHVLCQLKSTDAASIKVNKLDLDKLEYNAGVTRKMPVFAIQFLQSNQTYLLVKPEDLKNVAKYLETGENVTKESFLGVDLATEGGDCTAYVKPVIKSSSKAREQYKQEHNQKFKRKENKANDY